jgi:carbamoyltransferase
MKNVILGLSGPYHELSACLLIDGKVACMVEEERLSRVRHGKAARIDNAAEWPSLASEICLADAGLLFSDVDHIAYPFVPHERLRNIGCDRSPKKGDFGSESGETRFVADVLSIEHIVRAQVGSAARFQFHFVPHHVAHAASAFYPSPFDEAAILAIDGIGEFDTTWFGSGKKNKLCAIRTLSYPHSLGFVWEVVSDALGFGPYGASKVMGLAAYGDKNRYENLLSRTIQILNPGAFCVDEHEFAFRQSGLNWVARTVPEALCGKGEPPSQASADLAAALQNRTEETLLHLLRWLKQETGLENVCMAGGVALNCAANGRVAREQVFRKLFVQPAAHDAGTALGAALALFHRQHPGQPRFLQVSARLGPRRSSEEVAETVRTCGLPWQKVPDTAEEVADRLARGQVVGFYRTDGCEVGPRALGGRSLLADPRLYGMRERINRDIKRREDFRPFGPAVLAEHAKDWLSVPDAAELLLPFMLAAVKVKSGRADQIAAVVHRDGSTRPQFVSKDGSLYRLAIERFFLRTGVPMVLNTSLNVQEPIVETPREAVRLVAECGVDALLLDDVLVVRRDEPSVEAAPAAALRFEPSRDRYGKRLALVFGNEAKDGACPFHRLGQCNHCDIGEGEGHAVDAAHHARRWAWFQHHYRREWASIEHLVFYNSGSVLAQKEMSPEALRFLCEQAAKLPNLKMLSLDSREGFVTRDRVRPVRDGLPSNVALRIILGLESADDEVRLIQLNKRMPLDAVRRAAQAVAESGDAVGLWLNLVFAPPGVAADAAVEDLLGGIRFGAELCRRYGLPLDFNIHPFYPSKKSQTTHPRHPRAKPELLFEAMDLAENELRRLGCDASLFLGWQDEQHDQEQTLRLREHAARLAHFST